MNPSEFVHVCTAVKNDVLIWVTSKGLRLLELTIEHGNFPENMFTTSGTYSVMIIASYELLLMKKNRLDCLLIIVEYMQ